MSSGEWTRPFQVHWITTTTLPFPLDVLTGGPEEMHWDCAGDWDPFTSGVFLPPVNIPYNDSRLVPVYNAAGEIIGYMRKIHIPGVDPPLLLPSANGLRTPHPLCLRQAVERAQLGKHQLY